MKPGRLAATSLLVAVASAALAAAQAPTGWVEVGYGALVDRRVPSHSGETVGELLARLGGRPLPAASERAADRQAHALLEPLVEGYAFVLSDALDALHGAPQRPLVELGWLWQPGEAQPAWAELLRSRRYVVESDGAGTLRVCVPDERAADAGASADAARAGYDAAWPILRHVFAAELRRLGAAPRGLDVRVHAYRHAPERSTFVLGVEPWTTRVMDTRSDGRRPPLDLALWQAFLASGLRLEGARLDPDGTLRPFGSPVAQPPRILGRPLALQDLAVAWRAVAHGGLAEPYMSLDRGFSPETAIVNYGGRLQDTALGMVSLLCDIRFKTFSLGLDILDGRDLRATLRESIPTFRTHMERFAADPASRDVLGQQTRLWFYPDRVDLTLSAERDVLVLRRVRMSAASERVDGDPSRGDPPWTRATVEAIDRDYDALGRVFPELHDLDEVVRLLALATWLVEAQRGGHAVPDLDALLALELEARPTPRRFPQLLAFNALPASGSSNEALVFDRVPIGEALGRLAPADGLPLPARRRLERALGALDPADPQVQALLGEARDLERLDEAQLDTLAFRAERLRMHQRVLSTLEPEQRQQVVSRRASGEELRIFSVAIGGLDLGMSQALSRAAGSSAGIVAGGSATQSSSAAPRGPVEAWRREADDVSRVRMPLHGLRAKAQTEIQRDLFGNHRIEVQASPERSVWVLLGADSPDVRSRRVGLSGAGRPDWIERAEGVRFLRYRLEGAGAKLEARVEPAAPANVPDAATAAPPARLATFDVTPAAGAGTEAGTLRVRVEAAPEGNRRPLEAGVPRSVLQRVVTGRIADPTPDRPLAALADLPPALGALDTVLFVAGDAERRLPWEPRAPLAGEEDATRLARGFDDWWAAGPSSRGVHAAVASQRDRSLERWGAAPRPSPSAVLIVPPGSTSPELGRLREAWRAGPVREGLDELPASTNLVILLAAESPGVFAARVRELAGDERMNGKLLAVWNLVGDLRPDLPHALVTEGRIAALGVAGSSVVERRDAARALESLQRALADGAGRRRVEALDGPFLWYF